MHIFYCLLISRGIHLLHFCLDYRVSGVFFLGSNLSFVCQPTLEIFRIDYYKEGSQEAEGEEVAFPFVSPNNQD